MALEQEKNMSKSLSSIARLLGAEGFSDFTKNEVIKYWKNRSGLTERQLKHIESRKKAFSAIMAKLDDSERLIVGKYIGFLEKACFETGLKLGLMTSIVDKYE